MKTAQKTHLQQIFELLTHNGLTTYKTKNSKATLFERAQVAKLDARNKKGGVFVVRSKQDFTSHGVKGYIVTSRETLEEVANRATHFTPNIYRKYQYTDDSRRYICGFEEENLQQVNAFVVDIDTKKYSVNNIVMTCIDESIGVPTLIIESDRGYQLYFALNKPIYISNKHNYRSLKVAKRISNNIKRSLASVEADLFCNDFGFFRIPNNNNIVFFQPQQLYEVKQLIDWSMRQDDDLKRSLFVVPRKVSNQRLTQSEWFRALVNTKDVKGAKGELGRNNLMFTLALACFSDGLSEEDAFNLLDVYNSSLNAPLLLNEMKTLISSAYSGKYKGPKAEYVKELLDLHVPENGSISTSVGSLGWYKHKKKREDRVRSHGYEWEQDIIKYIHTEKKKSEPYLWMTQRQLCQSVGIPQSTLNKLIKESNQLIRFVIGKGRGARTGWTTVQLFMKYIIEKLRADRISSIEALKVYLFNGKYKVQNNPAAKLAISYIKILLGLSPPGNTQYEEKSG